MPLGNAYPANLLDAKGKQILPAVEAVQFTSSTDQPESGGGGGLPLQTGAGSPLGAVVPTQTGGFYLQTTPPALWWAGGATNTDWVVVAGQIVTAPLVGVLSVAGDGVGLQAGSGASGSTLAVISVGVDGPVDLAAGTQASGTASAVSIAGGAASAGNANGGDVQANGGSGFGTGPGGNVTIQAGAAPGAGAGGIVNLIAGGSDSGQRGLVQLTDSTLTTQLQVQDGAVLLPNLPTADPSVAGQLWSNLGVLTVSGG